MTTRVKHEWEYYLDAFELEFNKEPRDNARVEICHAQYINAWHRFEEQVFMQCGLPRHQLLLKRANFG